MTVTSVRPRDGEFLALEEIHAAALDRLPRDAATYLESGAGTERTLRANREAFTRWVIRPRPMTGVTDPKTNTEFLGIPLSVPVLTAPFGGDALFAPEGHLAVARANAACGIASIVPEVGSFSYEQVAAASPPAARIAQLHPYDSFDAVATRIKAAAYGLAAAGERGVRRTIELLTQELHILMTLAGVPDIPSLTRDTVARR